MILVTGANGLIGSFVCQRLFELEIPFRGLVRAGADLSLVKNLGKNLIQGDFMDIEYLQEQLPNFDKIVHCAAIISFSKDQRDAMHRINVIGTRQLVDMALRNNIEYFIHVSSVAAIGRAQGGKVVDENNTWIASKKNSAYGESKHQAELEVWRGIQEGLPAAIINPSVVLAPGDINKSSTKLFKYVLDENKYYGGGKLNYVDIGDVVSIILLLLDRAIIGERMILTAGAISYNTFFEKVAKSLGKKPPYKQASKSLAFLALFFFRLKSLISGIPPLVTKESIRISQDSTVFDNNKVKKMLGFQFKELDETVKWVTKELIKKIDQ